MGVDFVTCTYPRACMSLICRERRVNHKVEGKKAGEGRRGNEGGNERR